ncbi:MAG: hypothetical protein SNJ71_06130, partial [Bacteroidales bacterium]
GYDHVIATFPAIDITSNPQLKIRLKAASNFTLRIDIGSNVSGTTIYANCASTEQSVNVTGNNTYQTITIDYKAFAGCYPSGTVDPKNITNLNIMFNPGGGYNGTVDIDWIQIGDTPISGEAKLASLTVSGANTLQPSFNSKIFVYIVELTAASSFPTISATAIDAKATVTITQTNSFATPATVKVIAEDQSERIYTVQFVQKQENITQSLQFVQGWNLFSLYLNPQIKDIETVFSTILPEIEIIKTTNTFYSKDLPVYLNTLTTIEPATAYLIKVKKAVSVTLAGTALLPTVVTLEQGWNLVGYPLQTNTTISTKISTIMQNISEIKNFDGWYKPANNMSSITQFQKGYGYYFNVINKCNLQW